MDDSTPTPVPAAAPEIPWRITGRITPASIGLPYKIGVTLNAVAMLMLPGLYLAIAGGLGWFIYSQTIGDTPMPGEAWLRENLGGWYYLLLIAGAITLLFMIKPLFARRKKSAPPLEITRAEQPGFFALIDEVCALVRAPRPRRVFVDMQVNASASFSRNFGSLLRRDLTLTIGLPLVAGLSVRELGGVVAHEFGHFAQGAGMRMTYVIRATNAWLARIVYERDGLDEFLREASRRIDVRIGVIFWFARLMVWLTRKILWVFMWLGGALSCFMLRQMEFDADHYETQVAGSEGFVRTMAALRLLGVCWQRAAGTQQESYAAGRLVDDMPGLVSIEARRLPTNVRDAIDRKVAPADAGWFATHPSDARRVRAAKDADAAGVLAGEGPAMAIFDDFSSLARRGTVAYYEHECEIDLKRVQLLPLETVANEINDQEETRKATEYYFHGLLTAHTMLFLSPGELLRTPPREQLTAEWNDAVRRQTAALPGAESLVKGITKADGALVSMAQARATLRAGFKLKAGQFDLAKPTWDTVVDSRDEALRKIAECHEKLAAVRTATRDRFVAALRAYFLEPLPSGLRPDGRAEIEGLARILTRFEPLAGALVSMRNEVAAFDLLLRNVPKEASSDFYKAAYEIGASLNQGTERVIEATEALEYPFDHARGKVLLSTFLVEAQSHSDESIHAFLRARALIDRFFAMYDRIHGRLTRLGMQAEQEVLSGEAQREVATPAA